MDLTRSPTTLNPFFMPKITTLNQRTQSSSFSHQACMIIYDLNLCLLSRLNQPQQIIKLASSSIHTTWFIIKTNI